MVHAEAYFLWNAAMCLCVLPLGGRLAGLPAPGRGALGGLRRAGGALALCALVLPPLQILALAACPVRLRCAFARTGWVPACAAVYPRWARR